jgi:hypothetical protein
VLLSLPLLLLPLLLPRLLLLLLLLCPQTAKTEPVFFV